MPALNLYPRIYALEATLDAVDGNKVDVRVRTRAHVGSTLFEMDHTWSQVAIPLVDDWWADFGTPDIEADWTDAGYTLPV